MLWPSNGPFVALKEGPYSFSSLLWGSLCFIFSTPTASLSDLVICLYNPTDFSPLTLYTWKWRQYIAPNRRYPPTRLYGITTKKTAIWTEFILHLGFLFIYLFILLQYCCLSDF
jgi:hypothetical protein